MPNESELSPHENTPIMIDGKKVDLEEILEAEGRQQFGKILIKVTPTSIDIRPIDQSQFFFRAEVSTSGELALNIALKSQDGARNSQMPAGQDLVRVALRYLESHNEIKTLIGTWKEGTDNFKQFLMNKKQRGLSDNESALQTWTGENIAVKFGFRNVVDVYQDMRSDERLVIAKFSRNLPDSL
ncbi:MAG: hypothetical protein ABI758_01215 [Candidatus Woesebacteria bacterium]